VAVADDKKQWLAFAPTELAAGLKPLAKRRHDQGWQTTIVVADGAAQDVLIQIEKRSKAFEGKTVVVLCGSYGVSKDSAKLPFLPGRKGRMFRQATDYEFGLPDEQGVPTISCGRLPARNATELKGMIQKIIRFEDQNVGDWTHRLNLIVADPGGASAMERRFADVIVQSALGSRIRSLHPRWRTTCIADTSNSQFAVEADEFGKATNSMFAAGQLFSCYCGHSGPAGLWSRQDYVLLRDDFMKLSIKNSSGIFVSCGCFGCQVSGRGGQGYVLAAMQNPNGPVAAIGAFGESYAAMGQLALDGLMSALNRKTQPRTLGEYWLAVQNGLAHGKINGLTFWLYDQADGSGGKVPLAKQRQEHLEMWTLLGDPALRLPLLSDTPVQLKGEIKTDETIHLEMAAEGFPDKTPATVSIEYRFRRPSDKLSVLARKSILITSGVAKTDFLVPEFDSRRDVILRIVAATKQKRIQGVVLTKGTKRSK
jgi:hypothetical protein